MGLIFTLGSIGITVALFNHFPNASLPFQIILSLIILLSFIPPLPNYVLLNYFVLNYFALNGFAIFGVSTPYTSPLPGI